MRSVSGRRLARAVERKGRALLERDQRAAHSATDRAIETLVGELSLSVRGAGDVLGLSQQRVHPRGLRRGPASR